jgi:hypothetical protein
LGVGTYSLAISVSIRKGIAMVQATFFVAHDFVVKARDDLRTAIAKAFEAFQVYPQYADDEVGQRHILDKIKAMIREAQFGIYDISNPQKPNVFLELGYAMATEKPYYLICESGTSVPADLAGLDRIEYNSYKHLIDQLQLVVQTETQKAEKLRALRQSRYRPEDILEENVLQETAVSCYLGVVLQRKFGADVDDPQALTGRARKGDLWHARTHLVYGPYEELPEAGRYRAFFKLKLSHNSYAPEPVLMLDVWGGGVYESRHIFAAEFNKPMEYQLFALDFAYPGNGKLEYRVYNMTNAGTAWVDYVAVIRLPPAS